MLLDDESLLLMSFKLESRPLDVANLILDQRARASVEAFDDRLLEDTERCLVATFEASLSLNLTLNSAELQLSVQTLIPLSAEVFVTMLLSECVRAAVVACLLIASFISGL